MLVVLRCRQQSSFCKSFRHTFVGPVQTLKGGFSPLQSDLRIFAACYDVDPLRFPSCCSNTSVQQ